MGRVTVHVADPLLSALDEEAHNKSISRSQAVANAIEFFISGDNQVVLDAHNKLSEAHNKLSASEEEVMRLKQKLSELANQIAEKNNTIEANSSDVKHIRADLEQAHVDNAQLKLQIDQAADLKNELDQLKTRYNQSLSEATERWEELKGYKSEVTKLKKLLDESQAIILHLKDDLLKRQSETNQLAKTSEELALAKMETDKLKETMALKNEEVSFLRGHVSQLTQTVSQLALPPSQEEAKKKGWWQFWR